MYKRMVKSAITVMALFYGICDYACGKIPEIVTITYGQQVQLQSEPFISMHPTKEPAPTRRMNSGINTTKYTATLFGVIPLKEVTVISTDQRYVAVSGKPFGIKMFCDGVMVVGFSDILTTSGYKNPAKMSGLKTGDIVTAINYNSTKTNEDVERIISKSNGNPVVISFLRGEEQQITTLTPVKDTNNGNWRSGIWVRDSGAGIGTMTFYDTVTDYFAGLGHGIKDADTHQELRLLSGEIVPVKITGIVKSKNGTAGQLKGSFTTTVASGKILHNGTTGVYGKAYTIEKNNLMPVATPSQIHTGKAHIITTISGNEPQKYEIEIEKVNLTTTDPNKNMIIKITDSRLLTLTGGIVRGFSGSPIVQDDMLVGAVTHVFVNQVDKGYGIFATNMLDTLDSVYNSHLKSVA